MIPHERSLVKKFEGEPFVLLGVNTDSDKEKYYQQAEDMGVTWRSAWQGSTNGPISKLYAVEGYPTLFLIDHKGVIVETDYGILRGEQSLEAAIEKYVTIAKAESGEGGKDLILLPPWLADDTYDSLAEEFSEQYGEWRRKSRDERGASPHSTFYPRFRALAEGGDGRSMLWIVRNIRSVQVEGLDRDAESEHWARKLVADHAGAEWITPLATFLYRDRWLALELREELLRSWWKAGAHETVETSVGHALGQVLFAAETDEKTAEAIALYGRLIDEFPEDPIAQRCKGEVFRRTKLQVGMVAPDFETEDVDGVAFQLSDYRGKVVLIDFWGFW
jgi:thiol-disulfide isomerase/thioredoxin